MSELKPCPFCGGAADYAETTDTVDGQEFRIYLAGCPNHCAQIWQGDPDSAMTAWNARTPDLAKVKERLEEALRDIRLHIAFDSRGDQATMEEHITAALALLDKGGSDAQS